MVQFVKLHLDTYNEECLIPIDKIVGIRKDNQWEGGSKIYFNANDYWLVKETVKEVIDRIVWLMNNNGMNYTYDRFVTSNDYKEGEEDSKEKDNMQVTKTTGRFYNNKE